METAVKCEPQVEKAFFLPSAERMRNTATTMSEYDMRTKDREYVKLIPAITIIVYSLMYTPPQAILMRGGSAQ